MQILIDIETIPDQSEGAIDRIKKDIEVKVPADLTKPKLMDTLGCTDKYKTVGELKGMWLETFGEEQKVIQANEKWLKTSFDGAYGQVICIGAEVVHSGEQFCQCTGDEVDLLESFWDWVLDRSSSPDLSFIAHHKKFDLPFMFHRSVIKGVRPTLSFDPHSRKHECTMELWAGFGGRIGLDRLAGILGLSGKSEGMSGAEVWPEYQKGNLKGIAGYCAQDREVLKAVYNRIKFINQ
jgi:hypothetical protein